MGAMPELMRRSELSFMGIRGKLLRRRWSLLSKNARYFSRSSLSPVHFIFVFFLSKPNNGFYIYILLYDIAKGRICQGFYGGFFAYLCHSELSETKSKNPSHNGLKYTLPSRKYIF